MAYGPPPNGDWTPTIGPWPPTKPEGCFPGRLDNPAVESGETVPEDTGEAHSWTITISGYGPSISDAYDAAGDALSSLRSSGLSITSSSISSSSQSVAYASSPTPGKYADFKRRV